MKPTAYKSLATCVRHCFATDVFEQARRIADAKNRPIEMVGGHYRWTVESVLTVALKNGLAEMERQSRSVEDEVLERMNSGEPLHAIEDDLDHRENQSRTRRAGRRRDGSARTPSTQDALPEAG